MNEAQLLGGIRLKFSLAFANSSYRLKRTVKICENLAVKNTPLIQNGQTILFSCIYIRDALASLAQSADSLRAHPYGMGAKSVTKTVQLGKWLPDVTSLDRRLANSKGLKMVNSKRLWVVDSAQP